MAVNVRVGSSWVPIGGAITSGTTKIATLYDAKTQNTGGGSVSSAGSFNNIRVLNTKVDPQSFVTFGGGSTGTNGTNTSFSLPAGSYYFQWRAPAWDAGLMRARLAYNVNSDFSGTTNYILGESAQSDTYSEANTFAFGSGTLTTSVTTYFRIEHYVSGGTLGLQSNIAEEIYTQVIVQDLATAIKESEKLVVNTGKTKIAVLEDQKASNTNGGTFASGAWQDRTLNTETDPQSFVTLDGGNIYFSLPAGTYEIDWSAPASMVDKHQSRLIYATNTGFSSGVGYVYGSSEMVDQNETTNIDCTRSFGSTVITTSAITYFKIQHRCSTTYSNTGFGTPNNFTGDSQVEVYTKVKIQDLATAIKELSSSNNVYHVQKTDVQTIDNETWTDITGLSQTVSSPTASTKFLITATVNASMSNNSGHDGLLRLMRGTTVIGSTSTDGSSSANQTGFAQISGQDSYYTIDNGCITYVDTPGVGSHTYHIEGLNCHDTSNLIVNGRTEGSFYMVSHMSIQQFS